MQGTTHETFNFFFPAAWIEAVLHLPILTTIVAAVFCVTLALRYRERGGLHLLWWAIGMATYGLGTLTESWNTLFGWTPVNFKLWYVFGAFLGGYPLAQGSLYLLAKHKKWAHLSVAVVVTVIAVGAVSVALSPVTQPADARLSGTALDWQWIRMMTPWINIYSAIVLIGGAVVSALRFRRSEELRDRYLGNILIAIGALLPGIGGTMTRMGHVEVLYVTEFVGLLFIFAGYRKCVAAPQPRAAVRPAIAMLALVLGAGTVWAQESTPEAAEEATNAERRHTYYGTVNVTATGNEVDTHQVAQPVTVLTDIDLRLADHAADLLRWEPGVDVDGVGANQVRPVIRGLRGLRVLFLEDGLRMNNARRQTDFGEITGLVPNELVDRIEVVRGAASVLYGTDAVGGVINLVTHHPQVGDGWTGGARITGGSIDDSVRTSGNLALRRENWSLSGSAGLRDASAYEAPSGSFGDIRLEDDITVQDTGVEDSFLEASYRRDLNPSHSLTLSGRSYQADDTGFGLVDPALLGDDDFLIRILYPEQDFTKLVGSHLGTGLVWADTLEIQLYVQSNERELVNDIDINIGPIFPGAPDSSIEADTLNNTELDTWGVRSEATKAADASLWTYGLEAFSDDSFNTDFSLTTTTIRFPFPPFEMVSTFTDDVANTPNATNSSLGGFAQYEQLIGDRTHVSFGTRYQTVETQAEPTPGWDTTGLDFDDSAWVGAATVRHQVGDGWQLVGSVGSSFRAPGIVERLFNGPTPEGAGFQILNPELKSETGLNYDAGFKFRGRRAFAEFTWFENRLSDGITQHFLSVEEVAQLPPEIQAEIAALGPGVFVVQQRNIEELTYSGLELVGGLDFDNGVSVGGNFSLLDAERTDSLNPPTGESYDDKTSAYLRYGPRERPWYAEYRLRYSSSNSVPLAPNEPPPIFGTEVPSIFVQQIAAGWIFARRAGVEHRLDLVVNNLGDRLYAEASNASFFRPQPGLGARLSYAVRF